MIIMIILIILLKKLIDYNVIIFDIYLILNLNIILIIVIYHLLLKKSIICNKNH